MSGCRKRRFDELGARIALASMERKRDFGNRRRRERRMYWCAPCRAYHLTSQPRAARKLGGNDGSGS